MPKSLLGGTSVFSVDVGNWDVDGIGSATGVEGMEGIEPRA